MSTTPESTTPDVSPLDSLSFNEYEHWRETGELPKAEASDESQAAQAVETGSEEETDEQTVEPADAETEENTSDDSEQEEEQKKRPRGGFQRKIQRLRTENEELQQQLLALNTKLAPATPEAGGQQQTQAPQGEPNANDFADYGEYVKALTNYQVKQQSTNQLNAERERLERAAHEKRVETWNERLTEARTRYSDFDARMSADVIVSPAMQQLLLDSEVGADVAYWLGSHVEDAKRIAALPPLATAREIGRIEASLQAPPPVQKKTSSSAPPPPTAVRGARSPEKHNVYDEQLASDFGAWEKARNQQIKRR